MALSLRYRLTTVSLAGREAEQARTLARAPASARSAEPWRDPGRVPQHPLQLRTLRTAGAGRSSIPLTTQHLALEEITMSAEILVQTRTRRILRVVGSHPPFGWLHAQSRALVLTFTAETRLHRLTTREYESADATNSQSWY